MKTWTEDNPKKGLLARKRAAILAAARRQFLSHGYDGTSMEAVAADAGVSIMTLYRHAESKDDLFAAAISIACHTDGEPLPDLSKLQLADLLVNTAIAFQEKLSHPETIALFRAVIAEHERFPALAETAYRAAVGHLADFVETILAGAPEAKDATAARRAKIAAGFVDALFGADTLRVLLGLSGTTAKERKVRAEAATREVLTQLGVMGLQQAG